MKKSLRNATINATIKRALQIKNNENSKIAQILTHGSRKGEYKMLDYARKDTNE